MEGLFADGASFSQLQAVPTLHGGHRAELDKKRTTHVSSTYRYSHDSPRPQSADGAACGDFSG